MSDHLQQISTVVGAVDAGSAGITLTHEHLFIDLSVWFEEPTTPETTAFIDQPVQMSLLGRLRRQPFATTRHNLRLDDFDLAVAETLAFKRAGGATIVDVTPSGLGREPLLLQRLARETGLNIVMGCGYYVEPAHPPELTRTHVDVIAEHLIDEVLRGADGTGVKAGIIGEIGTSGIDRVTGTKRGNITPDETKVLRAAARASLATGAAVSVHLDPRGQGAFDVLDVCNEEEMPLDRLILGHLDHVPDTDYHRRVAASGAWVQYDNFGREYYWDSAGVYWNNDQWRVRMLAELVRAGHVEQLLVSQDVALKMDLRFYGGYGYDHILTDITPAFRREGVSDADIRTILVDNPRRALALRRFDEGGSGGA
jgi:phosphotriesterase-related protein